MSKNVTVLIPARLASKRFPYKPLVRLGDKTVVERCYDWASLAGYPTYVVSGDDEILDLFPGKSIRTKGDYNNGTERCLEGLKSLSTSSSDDVVINVQGDIVKGNPVALRALAGMIRSKKVSMGTVLTPTSPADYRDNNSVKVVIDRAGRVLFFTREPVMSITEVRSHVGIYAMSVLDLAAYGALRQCTWEQAESLEQMRWLYWGYRIGAYVDNHPYLSINVPEDLQKGRDIWEV